MLPAQQGLEADDAPGGQVDLGLVMELELVLVEGLAQIVGELVARLGRQGPVAIVVMLFV